MANATGKDPEDHKNQETLPVEVGKVLVPILRRQLDDGLLKALMQKPIMPMSQCTILSGDIVLGDGSCSLLVYNGSYR